MLVRHSFETYVTTYQTVRCYNHKTWVITFSPPRLLSVWMLRTGWWTCAKTKCLLREVIATVQGRTVVQVLLGRLWVLKYRNLRTKYCLVHFTSWKSSAAMKCHSHILRWRHDELWQNAQRSRSFLITCCKCYKLKQQTALTLMF